MLQAVINAFKIADLRRKILFTLAMLVVFRIVAHIPVPGANLNVIEDLLNPGGASDPNNFYGVLNLLNIFSVGR